MAASPNPTSTRVLRFTALGLAALCATASMRVAAGEEVASTWSRARPGTLPPPIERPAYTYVPRGVPAVLSRRAFNEQIVEAARKAGVDPALVHAVVRVESAYNPGAVSPKGAVGLMQVIPSTGRRFGVDDLLNPSANLRAGTQYLSYLMRLFEGDVRLALAAYNAGEGAVLRHGRTIPPYRETRGYVPRVLSIYESLVAQRNVSPELARGPASD